MSESKRRKPSKVKGDLPNWCKSEVRWMFGYLDLNGDEKLSLQELYHMEHDHSEKCVKPFVDSCDTDRDIFISPKEWCHCFDKTDRPCTAAKRRLSPDMLGEDFRNQKKNYVIVIVIVTVIIKIAFFFFFQVFSYPIATTKVISVLRNVTHRPECVGVRINTEWNMQIRE